MDLVSASLKTEGEQQMTMVVLQFPPRESWRIRVILLSRYGTCVFYLRKERVLALTAHSKKNYRSKLAKRRNMWEEDLQPGLWILPNTVHAVTHVIGSWRHHSCFLVEWSSQQQTLQPGGIPLPKRKINERVWERVTIHPSKNTQTPKAAPHNTM